MKNLEIVDYTLLTLGTTYSIANIESVLGIVILMFQLGWILTKTVCRIYKAFKSGKPAEEIATETVSAVIDFVDGFEEVMSAVEVDDNGQCERAE